MTTTAGADAALERRIDELVVPIVDEAAMVGMSLGVVRGGRLVASRGYGCADVAGPRPADAATVYRIGSISKTMTAVVVMQLVEQGRVALDDPVTEHLRAYAWSQPAGTRPATLRDLLTHTSGMGELRSWADLRDTTTFTLGVDEGEPVPGQAEYYRKGLRTSLPPGQRWVYANHAIATLGQVVEDVTGRPFTDVAREQVFAALGMTGSDFVLQPGQRPHLATGYRRSGAKVERQPWRDIVTPAAGSVFSSVDDMALYTAALLNGGANEHGRVLDPESVGQMLSPQWRAHPSLPGQGLAFKLDDFDGHRIAWHDGGWPAFRSTMMVAPDDDLAVLAFTNSGTDGTHEAVEVVLRDLLGVPLTTAEARRRAPAAPHTWADLVGVYAPTRAGTANLSMLLFGLELEVLVRDGHLLLRPAVGPLRRGVRLHRSDPDDPLQFETVVESLGVPQLVRVAFRRGPDGRAAEIVAMVENPYQMVRRPALRSARRLGRLAGAAGAAGVLAAARAARQHARREGTTS
jgi:CubicO group peptidase (beta-lactamase class C family)